MRLSQCFFLLGSCADCNRIAAQESREHCRRDAKIDVRHLLANEVDVKCAAAEAAAVFGNEEELDAQLVGAAHVVDDVERAFIFFVQLADNFVGQALPGEIAE
jgi:hypothetical protein